MGRVREVLDPAVTAFCTAQPVFFVATAPSGDTGHVNCSPKGNDGTFAVLGDHRAGYLDLTGSGIETAAHLRENGRIVLMFCAFEGKPRIVRLHGRGRVVVNGDPEFAATAAAFGHDGLGARAVVVVDVTRISDSCGYNVPLLRFEGHRDDLVRWAQRKGPDGLVAYREERNARSIDGLPGLPAGAPAQVADPA